MHISVTNFLVFMQHILMHILVTNIRIHAEYSNAYMGNKYVVGIRRILMHIWYQICRIHTAHFNAYIEYIGKVTNEYIVCIRRI